ncbi:unnamed protein product [Lactuca virosa]|uniref:Uncharacterized protein n=1 Tax=Lactuca virosa TaxID=75947 RepID=A0AAU9MJC3_9ASTR|nr:unnamed protein product [Lactuca virosa]
MKPWLCPSKNQYNGPIVRLMLLPLYGFWNYLLFTISHREQHRSFLKACFVKATSTGRIQYTGHRLISRSRMKTGGLQMNSGKGT